MVLLISVVFEKICILLARPTSNAATNGKRKAVDTTEAIGELYNEVGLKTLSFFQMLLG